MSYNHNNNSNSEMIVLRILKDKRYYRIFVIKAAYLLRAE